MIIDNLSTIKDKLMIFLKASASPSLTRAQVGSSLRKNSDPFAESRSQLQRSETAPELDEQAGYADQCSIQ
jgi:hypothetical protein